MRRSNRIPRSMRREREQVLTRMAQNHAYTTYDENIRSSRELADAAAAAIVPNGYGVGSGDLPASVLVHAPLSPRPLSEDFGFLASPAGVVVTRRA